MHEGLIHVRLQYLILFCSVVRVSGMLLTPQAL